MKLAVVLALAPDRRSGRVVSGLLPADQAVSLVKAAITSGGSPEIDSAFNTLVAVDVGNVLRQHRFTNAPAPSVKKPTVTTDFKGLKKADLEAHLTAALNRIRELEGQLERGFSADVETTNEAAADAAQADAEATAAEKAAE